MSGLSHYELIERRKKLRDDVFKISVNFSGDNPDGAMDNTLKIEKNKSHLKVISNQKFYNSIDNLIDERKMSLAKNTELE